MQATLRAGRPQVSVIVPAYREAHRIGPSLETLGDWLAANVPDHEVIVVDDGSPDATAEVVRAWADGSENRRLISYKPNRGKGFAVRTGLAEAKGRIVFFTDADLSTPAEEIARALPLFEGSDIVVGTRAAAEANLEVRQSFLRESMGRIFNLIARLVGVADISDTQCGFKGFRAEVLPALLAPARVDRFAFDVELLVLARKQGLRVRELPVTWRNDEESQVRMFADSARMFLDVLRVAVRTRLR